MLNWILEDWNLLTLLGMLAAFFGTFFLTGALMDKLPRDGGRDFAVDGKKSAGKPRGAGIIFIGVFAVAAALFAPVSPENIAYLIAILACMATGYLDDRAEKPWGELKKGLFDLAVAVLVTGIFLLNHGSDVTLALLHLHVQLPIWLFALCSVALIWGAINVTNCADGVDGLSGTLTIITLTGFLAAMQKLGTAENFRTLIILFVMCILAYLWYNATPSKLMMGDAGSRAMGLMIAISALLCGDPVLYLLLSLVLMLDGGLGLLKVTLIRVCKIHIMKNIRTPLHDHVRKNKEWSNTQCVFRFAILQILLVVVVVALI
jgi:phospho-N-acetylmuramoyl-pentapeptide-transferase